MPRPSTNRTSTPVPAADARSRRLPGPTRLIPRPVDPGETMVLKQGNLYLVTDVAGDVVPDGRGLGLYDLDTRVLSCSVLRVDGAPPVVLRSRFESSAGVVHLVHRGLPDAQRHGPDDDVINATSMDTLGIVRTQRIEDGLVTVLACSNFALERRTVVVEIELGMDAADMFEVRGQRRPRGAALDTIVDDDSITFGYHGRDGRVRRTRVHLAGDGTDSPPEVVAGSPATAGTVVVRWSRSIPAGGRVTLGWRVTSRLEPDPEPTTAVAGSVVAVAAREAGAPIDAGHRPTQPGWVAIESDSASFDRTIGRSFADLRLLMNDGPTPGRRYVAAGLPWYATLFGRDAIITALEVLPYAPDIAVDTLRVLADLQASATDPARDMAPGKIPHELRSGELARAGEIPHRPYYGTVDATPLWLVLLGETVRWTGDLGLVRELWPNALAALRWIDAAMDGGPGGFLAYARGGPLGLVNQGWKDSVDGIRGADGRTADPPLALIEVQGYVVDARRRTAELARAIGDADLAVRLEDQAAELLDRIDRAYWDDELGTYAVAVDAAGGRVASVTSNAGHALWSRVAASTRAGSIGASLLRPGLWSGWGVRTMAAGRAGYNPMGYHTGSVWPHDNAILAAGLRRAGMLDAAETVAAAILAAAEQFPEHRLPELYCGFEREPGSGPVPYPTACTHQAWSAGAPLSLLGTLLGLEATASERRLRIDRPRLPPGVNHLVLRGLRVGDASLDLRFERAPTEVRVAVPGGGSDVRVEVVR